MKIIKILILSNENIIQSLKYSTEDVKWALSSCIAFIIRSKIGIVNLPQLDQSGLCVHPLAPCPPVRGRRQRCAASAAAARQQRFPGNSRLAASPSHRAQEDTSPKD